MAMMHSLTYCNLCHCRINIIYIPVKENKLLRLAAKRTRRLAYLPVSKATINAFYIFRQSHCSYNVSVPVQYSKYYFKNDHNCNNKVNNRKVCLLTG